MADATVLPTRTQLVTTQLSRADFELPSLQNALNATDVTSTVKFNGALKTAAGATFTGGMLIGIESDDGFVETVLLPTSSSTDGQTFTGCVRGIDRGGLDYTVGDAAQVVAHRAGARVFCSISALNDNLVRAAIQGEIGTGANAFRIGDGQAGNKLLYAQNADASKPFIQFNDTANQWEISNDGVSTFVPGAGVGTITGGDGISVTSGDIDIDLADTTVFVSSSSGAGDNGKVAKLNASGKLPTGFITAGALADYISDVTATATQINNFSSGQLTKTFTAYENVADNDAVCLLPIEVEYFDQLTDADLTFGAANANARYAIKIIPTQTTSTLTTMRFRAREQSAGNTTLGDLTISIQTDNSGQPSGTVITNGSANAITQATQRTWGATMGTRTATWASSPTLTAGTTYWIVFQSAALSATQYLHLGVNSSYDENYLAFTRLTYDAFSATWGSSVTDATPFFWFNTQTYLLGQAIVPCDANWGGRTWRFIGFAQGAITAQSSGSVEYNIAGLTGLTPNKDYYLSTTAGAITTSPTGEGYNENTPPSQLVYKIGRSLASTTELQVRPGKKRIMIRESTAFTSTTTRQYILWFKPDIIRTFAGGLYNTGASEGYGTYGYDQRGAQGTAGLLVGPTTVGAGVGATSGSAGINASFLGAATYSDIGLTYVFTETGTSTIATIIEAEAD